MANYEISVADLDHWLISLRIISVSGVCLSYLSFWNKCQGSGNNLKKNQINSSLKENMCCVS